MTSAASLGRSARAFSGELDVALLAEADVAGVDPVLGQGLGAGRVLGQQLVADVVEVADDRHLAAPGGEPVADPRHGPCRVLGVDGDPDQLRAGPPQLLDLVRRRLGVGRVGVGHRLHDDRRVAADLHVADPDPNALAAPHRRQSAARHGSRPSRFGAVTGAPRPRLA
jgi:hypothetical protein